jgi:Ser/Thr protein kinase RdoA (MazF antagonist)
MVVLFEFIPGEEPKPEHLVAAYPQLGEISARMHRHAREWQRPAWFERHVWDYEGALGSRPNWGPWRAGYAAQASGIEIVERADAAMRQRLEAFGKESSRFGLIHSDLRLANLLVDGGRTKVIDFDDCGFGWFLYDVASSVTFLETHPDVDDIVAAWIEGYRSVAALSAEEIAAIPTFMMLRRLVIMGWAGSHPDTELARWMGDQYTFDTVAFADKYLSRIKR